MKRIAFLTLLLTCVPALASGAGAAKPPAFVKVTECVIRDDGEGGRSAAFRGVMTAVRGTRRMKMRFTLLEKPNAGELKTVTSPELVGWHRSKPGVKTFAYDQRVTNLRSGTVYRAQVEFRWMGSGGKVIKRLVRRSGACRQPGGLADLAVTDLTWSPGPRASIVNYSVTVANRGGSTARNVRVALRVDGSLVDSSDIPVLTAGETATVRFTGPDCARNVRAVVDPGGAIKEKNEDDNVLDRSCGV